MVCAGTEGKGVVESAEGEVEGAVVSVVEGHGSQVVMEGVSREVATLCADLRSKGRCFR